MRKFAPPGVAAAMLIVSSGLAFSAEGDWVTVGGDYGHTKYSTLKQITVANAARLVPAWSFDAGAGEVTPIVIDGALYYPSGSKIIALEAHTGKVLWQTDMSTLIPA